MIIMINGLMPKSRSVWKTDQWNDDERIINKLKWKFRSIMWIPRG